MRSSASVSAGAGPIEAIAARGRTAGRPAPRSTSDEPGGHEHDPALARGRAAARAHDRERPTDDERRDARRPTARPPAAADRRRAPTTTRPTTASTSPSRRARWAQRQAALGAVGRAVDEVARRSTTRNAATAASAVLAERDAGQPGRHRSRRRPTPRPRRRPARRSARAVRVAVRGSSAATSVTAQSAHSPIAAAVRNADVVGRARRRTRARR